MQTRIRTRRNAMQLRNSLIHAAVALAALNATGFANAAHAIVPGPAGADPGGAYPAWAIVAYPEGEVLVFAPPGSGNE
jgi:hypothetical protein